MSNQKTKTKKPESSSDDDMEIGGNVSDSFVIHGDGNTITVIETNDSSDSVENRANQGKPKTTKKPNTAITVALIGLTGMIVVALIDAAGNGNLAVPSPTPVPATAIVFTETTAPTPVPTDTVPPLEPTLTPVPAIDTPVPTLTPAPVGLGEDWMAGCISTLWKAYPANVPPTERGDGCWQEPVYAFSAENGDLDFLSDREGGPAEIYGLFALLPESGTVTFTVRLRELDNADLLMGVFPEQDVTSQGLLMTILNGDVTRRSVVQKDPLTYETIQGTVALNQGNGFSISFTFETLSARSRVNPNVFMTNQVSIPTAQKWLFLGYKGLRGAYRIEGTFLNFELKP